MPEIERIDRLHVVMSVEQHMRPAGIAISLVGINLGNDGGMAGGRPHLRLEAERLDVPGQMMRRLLAILRKGRIGRDRLDAQELEQPRQAVVEIGIDVVEHRLQFCIGHGEFP